MSFGKDELLAYMLGHRLAVVSTIGGRGSPESALVGIAVTPHHDVIFDTVTDSRKHGNLVRDCRASLVFSGPGEKTLQFEGVARALAVTGSADAELRDIYYSVWPDGRDRLRWPTLSYWCISPRWARYSDFDAGPLVKTFDWNAA
jgi:hypothetical protein